MTDEEIATLEREFNVEIRIGDAELERAMVIKQFGTRRAWALVSTRLLCVIDITDGRALIAYSVKLIDEYVAGNSFPPV